MGLSSLKRKLFDSREKSGYSDHQWHCDLRHTSEGLHQGIWRLSMDTFGEKNPRQCYRWEDCAMNFVILIRGRLDKLPDDEKVRK